MSKRTRLNWPEAAALIGVAFCLGATIVGCYFAVGRSS